MKHLRSIPPVVSAAAFLCLAILCVHLASGSAAASRSAEAQTWLPVIFRAASMPPTGVDVVSSNAFVPFAGSSSLYIVGEIKNNTGSNIRLVKVRAVLRDAGGQIAGEHFSNVLADALAPGQVSPFRFIISPAPAWTTYALTLDWSTATASWPLLQVLDTEVYFDSLNAFHVRGSVRNQHPDTRSPVKLLLTLYDSAGRVIGADWTYAEPVALAPGQQAPFDVDASYWMGRPQRELIAGYSVVAGGN